MCSWVWASWLDCDFCYPDLLKCCDNIQQSQALKERRIKTSLSEATTRSTIILEKTIHSRICAIHGWHSTQFQFLDQEFYKPHQRTLWFCVSIKEEDEIRDLAWKQNRLGCLFCLEQLVKYTTFSFASSVCRLWRNFTSSVSVKKSHNTTIMELR